MDKKTFISIISLLRKQYKRENKYTKASVEMFDGHLVYKGNSHIKKALELAFISATSSVIYDWLDWWLYECDGIQNNLRHNWYTHSESEKNEYSDEKQPLSAIFNGKYWAPRTPNELWDMIQEFEKT